MALEAARAKPPIILWIELALAPGRRAPLPLEHLRELLHHRLLVGARRGSVGFAWDADSLARPILAENESPRSVANIVNLGELAAPFQSFCDSVVVMSGKERWTALVVASATSVFISPFA